MLNFITLIFKDEYFFILVPMLYVAYRDISLIIMVFKEQYYNIFFF